MKVKHLHKLITAALFAALACVATMIIQIPSPTQGYVNLGDCIVLLAGWILGPVYGAAAAAVGSVMADILLGYMQYAPATFLIKGLVALAAYLLYRAFVRLFREKKLPALLVSSILAECIMVFGYFGYEAVILQYGIAAAAGLMANAAQAVMGIAAGTLLYVLLDRIPQIRKYFA